jgi:hypothetical protein
MMETIHFGGAGRPLGREGSSVISSVATPAPPLSTQAPGSTVAANTASHRPFPTRQVFGRTSQDSAQYNTIENLVDGLPLYARTEMADLSRLSPDRAELNLTDIHDLQRNGDLLSLGQEWRVGECIRRIELWPHRFAREGQMYAENAGIIALSGWFGRHDFCRCGNLYFRSHQKHPSPCNQWRVCPYCAHKRRMRMQRQFLPAYYRGRWWFLTLSFTRSAWVGWHAKEDISLWWDACRWALFNMLLAGAFRGVFVFEALHIESYWPHPLVLPHVHVIVLADEITPGLLDELRARVAAYSGQRWDSRSKKWIQPEQPEFIHATPINWAEKYVEQWPKLPRNDRSFFNQNVFEVIDGWEIESLSYSKTRRVASRRQHYFLGQLQHAHRDYVGIARKERDSALNNARVRDLLAECNAAQSLGFAPEDLGEPIEFQTPTQ